MAGVKVRYKRFEEFLPQRILTAEERRFAAFEGVEKCKPLNGLVVCSFPEPDSEWLYFFRCLPTGCSVEAKVRNPDHRDDPHGAYVGWYSARPRRRGMGKKTWKEIEEYLRTQKCVRRVMLEDISGGFWKRMGFKTAKDGELSNMKVKWLNPPKGCER